VSPGREAPFTRVSLRDQVRDLLLARMLSGEYPPGAKLVETRIAQELGVSQAPVREALRDLEQLGCVDYEPFRGSSVRAPSVDDLLEAYPVRAALEGVACRLAAERIGETELERLAELIEDMRRAGEAGDARAESAADTAFHATIVEAAGNRTLTRQWSQLFPHARTFISLALPASGCPQVAEGHVPILQALGRRDADAVVAAMDAHLADVADRLRPLTENATAKEAP
jgi:DNA-binding GntR family transcriptional regulator